METTIKKVIDNNIIVLVDRGNDFALWINNKLAHCGGNPLYGETTRKANGGFIHKYTEAIKNNDMSVLLNKMLSPF